MKPKTEKKLIKRELLKPLHHIDTSIIIESMKETKRGEICSKYLNMIGYKYRGCFSLSVFGEILVNILTKIKDKSEKNIFLDWFSELVMYKKIGIYTLRDLSLPAELTKMESRVKGTDALILASAVENKAVLVTLDDALLRSEIIKSGHKIKIVAPEYFVK